MANGKYTGKVTGVIGISCRHMFMLPGGVVDLHFAERYVDMWPKPLLLTMWDVQVSLCRLLSGVGSLALQGTRAAVWDL